MKYEMVSAKIPKKVKDKIKEYKINVSEVIRKSLEEEVKKREAIKIKKEIENNKNLIRKLKTEDVTILIRGDRER